MQTSQSEYASISETEYLTPGNFSCPGCMASLAMRLVLKAMGPNTVIALTTGCWTVIDGMWPVTSVQVALLHGAFGTAPAMGRGIRAALDMQGKADVQVLAWGGDGATFDIGMTALSAAAGQNEDMIYVCYDNEAYMNTGGQISTATPPGMQTTNMASRQVSRIRKKNIVEIMAAHDIPLAASASVAYPLDLVKKVMLARSLKGFRFLHVHAPCPTGWQYSPEEGVRIARLAVRARVQPLYHVLNGKYVLDFDPDPVPVTEYFGSQKKRSMTMNPEELAWIQQDVDHRWDALQSRVKNGR